MRFVQQLFLFILLHEFSYSQTWVPATPFAGPTGSNLNVVNHYLPWVSCMASYNNELYVGGNFTSVGGVVSYALAKWNGTEWTNIGPASSDCTRDMLTYNNKLYFTTDKLYSWDGNTITTETYTDQGQQVNIFGTDLHIFNNELYVVSNSLKLIKISNSSTSVIDLPYPTFSTSRICLEDFNGKLYLGTNDGIFVNENNNWINISGSNINPVRVIDLEAYNNNLYVLGYFNAIGSISTNNIAKYNGTSWSSVPLLGGAEPYTNPLGDWNYGTNHFNVINNELYLSHMLVTNSGDVYSPAIKFNGNQWIDFSLNHSGGGGCVHVHNNVLYCGGHFNTFSTNSGVTTQIENLAKLDVTLNTSEKSTYSNIDVYPNPTNSIISIELPEIYLGNQLELLDQFGRVVKTIKVSQLNTILDLSNLDNGVYVLRLMNSELENLNIIKN